MKILHIIGRLGDILFGDGEKRKKLSIENILYMVVAGGLIFLLMFLYEHRFGGELSCENAAKWLASWLGILICAIAALWSFVLGVLSQVVLLVCSLFGILLSQERGANLIAFLIGLISIAVIAGGAIFLYYKFL